MRTERPEPVMEFLDRYERFGTFSFITGLVMVLGNFGLLRSKSEFPVVLTFLISGVIFLVAGVVLLTLSKKWSRQLRKDELECVSAPEEVSDRSPPSYDAIMLSETGLLPKYDEAVSQSYQGQAIK